MEKESRFDMAVIKISPNCFYILSGDNSLTYHSRDLLTSLALTAEEISLLYLTATDISSYIRVNSLLKGFDILSSHLKNNNIPITKDLFQNTDPSLDLLSAPWVSDLFIED